MSKTGLAKMPLVVAYATNDIKARLHELYLLACDAPGASLVELGVRGGDSTRALLAACEDTGKTLYSYDIEDCEPRVRFETARMGLGWFKADWNFFEMDSVRAAKKLPPLSGSVGLVFVDTDHTHETTKQEIEAWAPHVLPGGYLVFHDYTLKPDGPWDLRDGVKPAIAAWMKDCAIDWDLEVLPEGPPEDTGMALLKRKP